ncbi:hypothetical protein [Microvirga splendida]|uniref:LPXTG cell wall anchor domain-containing protein n=1 Tax=Microvirga splendida TaxID=2795727 RepID=A0ABS0Y6V4_9HYPH|nr:hypothetical protein [Microvirga splendida]MBJ6127640.1 hypothetical protein [Microvirga splendida]
MIETLRISLLTMTLTAWSTIAMAQVTPGGVAPAPPGAAPVEPAGEGLDWLWIIVAVVVVAALLFYFLGRGRNTRV